MVEFRILTICEVIDTKKKLYTYTEEIIDNYKGYQIVLMNKWLVQLNKKGESDVPIFFSSIFIL